MLRAAALLGALLLPGVGLAVPESVDVLVMIVDFADAPAPPDLKYQDGTIQTVPLDIPNAEDVFFTNSTSTVARYAEMSQGDLTLTGQVIEVSIAQNIGTLTSEQWRAAADAAAIAQGFTLTDYDRLGYLRSAGFSGQMSTGGASAQGDWFWASSSLVLNERVFSHEIGHTFGFHHASEIQANGSIAETGDPSDFMGIGDAIHTNAVNKHKKGRLGVSRVLKYPREARAGAPER